MAARVPDNAEPIPGYRLIERIGRGGFGEVWKAEAPGGLTKAIKIVYGDLEAAGTDAKAAEQELKALNRVKSIRHPYILSLERFDIVDGQLLIVMELADRNLWDRFRECRDKNLPGIPRAELLGYVEEAAEALDLMNNHYQIQHLDIKPQNLFLVHNHVKVADFGLAKDIEGMRATMTGGVTPVYAAPETFNGEITRFCDQYSLAIVYQELLTGVRPFQATNTRQLMVQHIQGVPDLSPLPEGDREAVGRSLAKQPDGRFPTCSELVQALRRSGGSDPGMAVPRPFAAPPQSASPSTVPTAVGGGSMPPVGARPMTAPPAPPPRLVPARPGHLSAERRLVSATASKPAPPLTPVPTEAKAPPEQTGPGVLRPALIVGLGQTGRLVLEELRRAADERFGGPKALPHLSYLALDTEPGPASDGGPHETGILGPRDRGTLRLHRASHYLKPREGHPAVEDWIKPSLLYRLQRHPITSGMRAFGRLAFCDHYRAVGQRLRTALEACLDEVALAAAARQTELGLRTNRPRCYVIAHLGGGTGSGMFLDVAYLLKHQLRCLGYTDPDVQALLLLPPLERQAARILPDVINTCAALTELLHFNLPETSYAAQLDLREPPIRDPGPPFSACVLVPDRRESATPARPQAVGVAAGFLFRELLLAAGRTIDEVRARSASPARTFGAYCQTWPRQRLLQGTSRRFVHRLLTSWIAKEAAHLREPVAGWLHEQWAKCGLGTAPLLAQLDRAVEQLLGRSPEETFTELLAPLVGTKFEARTACSALDQFLRLVGKPDVATSEQAPSRLDERLQETARDLIAQSESQLAEMAVHFIEEPQYRLAGAEEAIRQNQGILHRLLQECEAQRLAAETAAFGGFSQFFPLIGGLQLHTSRKTATVSNLTELLRSYPRQRLQSLRLKALGNVYRTLLGNTPEVLREVNYCRAQLADVVAALGAENAPEGPATLAGTHALMPANTQALESAADAVISALTPEELFDFDVRLQDTLRRQMKGLVPVCLAGVEALAPLRALLREQSEAFLSAKLPARDPAEVFFAARAGEQDAARHLVQAFDEAVPELAGPRRRAGEELCLLGAPASPPGNRFRALARQALPDVFWMEAITPDDLIVYREAPLARLTDLPHLGAPVRTAIEQTIADGGDSPHSRGDVKWVPVGG